MRTIFTPLAESKMVAIFIQVNTGSLFEGKYLGAGISHLLEHSIFLGSKSFPKKDLFSKEIEKMGGIDLNAYTTYDHTAYFFSVFPQQLEKSLICLKDFMFYALLDKQEIRNEMGTIFGEMDMMEDHPHHCFYEFVLKNYYQTLPYSQPIIGQRKTFSALDKKALTEYYQATYQPQNMILSLAGHFETKKTMNVVKKIFDDPKILPQKAKKNYFFAEQKKPQWKSITHKKSICVETWHPKTLFPKLTIVYPTTDFDEEEHILLDLLPFFLTTDKSSLLYHLLKEKMQLVEDLSSYAFAPKAYAPLFGHEKEKGYFSFSFDLPKNLKNPPLFREKIEIIVAEMKKILMKMTLCSLKSLMGKKITHLLEGAKNNLLKDFFEEKESPMEVASTMATSMDYRNDLLLEQFYLEKVKNFTIADVQQIVKKYFCQQNPMFFLLLNKQLYDQGPIWKKSLREEKISWIKDKE